MIIALTGDGTIRLLQIFVVTLMVIPSNVVFAHGWCIWLCRINGRYVVLWGLVLWNAVWPT